MNHLDFIYRVWKFYADGFRNMTLGKTLWALVIVKLIVIFVILKWLFFPDFIKQNAGHGDEADFVAGQVMRSTVP